MNSVLSVRMDEEVMQMLDAFARKSKTGKDEIVNSAVRKYLYLLEINSLREELGPYAEAQGFRSEDEVLSAIS